MKSKKLIRFLIGAFIITTLTFLALKFEGYYNKENRGFIGFCGRLLNKTNKFVVTYNDINPKDIDVVWTSENGVSDTLVKAGNIKENINYEYGKESFTVYHKDTALVSGGFFSKNNNDPNDVEINITKKNEDVQVRFLINGEKGIIYNKN